MTYQDGLIERRIAALGDTTSAERRFVRILRAWQANPCCRGVRLDVEHCDLYGADVYTLCCRRYTGGEDYALMVAVEFATLTKVNDPDGAIIKGKRTSCRRNTCRVDYK